ncbi:MAG: preprotein translocase subunit YajC [Alphaproteobacteria bacterium]|nr:preprotein translocase subunit YajC [Alphaproteobacteria bacterium]
MLISTAWAQSAGAQPGGGDFFMSIVPLVAIFAIMWFLLIRPQQQKMKAHREQVAATRRGDRVTTGGGLIGTVVRVDDENDEVVVELAEGVRVRAVRSTLMDVRSKNEPVSGAANDDTKK